MESKHSVAHLIVKCFENEGVEFIFGLPGEENIHVIDALRDSKIRFILTRHEQGAAFMADIYGRLTRKAGVCLSTLGPGAINLLLGVADANLDSSPLVAFVAQGGLDRLNKESHQVIDLAKLFAPVTKWQGLIQYPDSTAEIIRKAFKQAQMERSGATVIILPEDVAELCTSELPLAVKQPKPTQPDKDQLERAAEIINKAKDPIILVGQGVCRHRASATLTAFVDETKIPVANTFMAKGVVSDKNPLSIGTIGFMKHDYINSGFDRADVVIAIGYDLVEYSPAHWNPHSDKKIIHIHESPAEIDKFYTIDVGIQGDISSTLIKLADLIHPRTTTVYTKSKKLIEEELSAHRESKAFPLKPQQIISTLRAALKPDDIVLCDTGAVKMWMARLYPCYEPDTCIISNSLATMGFALPGALAAKLIYPRRNIVAVMGDGAFLMNSQELETAKREGLAFVILIWRDDSYGLIEWKQELEFGRSSYVKFDNPDFVEYAKSFGIKGYKVTSAADFSPILTEALASNELVIIDCPVDYSENMKLIQKLGQPTESM